ncbi:cell division protein ZapA [Alcanivorax quisquiliarum]|uniref:Cell division protein ZapA n=1 Tax=Alcanivorax quisquiliarum TaxID=2933565 RepID=A0ABT0E5F5_9GAMM|nr:cell division protein ZapA [Alcanivorax quisquiliarum]MCK0537065.1 cell division protein ZapA [Alcanivorax quisquiliarum]
MSDSASVVVHLLDKEYRVACPPGERDNLIRAARFLDDRMREVREANVVGLERIAVMAALNLAHELLQSNSALDNRANNSDRLAQLLQKMDAEISAHQRLRDPRD